MSHPVLNTDSRRPTLARDGPVESVCPPVLSQSMDDLRAHLWETIERVRCDSLCDAMRCRSR